MTHILLTGGGTAGHVTPNIALIESFRKLAWEVSYVGSVNGIEREMIGRIDVPYYAVSSGKLRRYFSLENLLDPFKILLGVLQSLILCLRLRPDAVFSKGGFVAVPLVFAAWLLRIPVVSHESDVTPGLANRLTYRFCRSICVTFEETRSYLPTAKVVVAGTPLRQALRHSDGDRGRQYLGLSVTKPVSAPLAKPFAKPLLLVFGGSLGAAVINQQVRAVLPQLLDRFDVVHVTGPGHLDPELEQKAGYMQKAFITDAFGDVLAAADLVVSRAGANSLYELFSLRKPHLLIPLSKAASRGDQLDNAALFESLGYSRVIKEEALSNECFLAVLIKLHDDASVIREKLAEFEIKDSISIIEHTIRQSIGLSRAPDERH
ncbi:MAG: UDP-N-acetylglucosamine--N-acetylmuramyl-(pentapeptide) pyrophosphoryl-undecaprenol N-acetylglucosamine transferase [Candidatus Azotimanducaceae bacterium]